MKPFKTALLILFSSPLVWIGAAGALVGFSTFWLLWSGHLNPVAHLADALGIGFSLNAFVIPGIIVTGICFFFCGIILGIVRL